MSLSKKVSDGGAEAAVTAVRRRSHGISGGSMSHLIETNVIGERIAQEISEIGRIIKPTRTRSASEGERLTEYECEIVVT